MISQETITIRDVENATMEFFRLHWNTQRLSNLQIQANWAPYNFVGTVKDGDKQGCYALVKDSEVIYIGLGASRGGGIYEGHGIGARLNSHVLKWDKTKPAPISKRKYMPQLQWNGINQIYTFGFPSGYGYLACALEAYLISKLRPTKNITKTSNN